MVDDVIRDITAREILGASGRPTVEASVITMRGATGVASVPSGTSKGRYEAHELRDGGERYRGLGCRRAAANVREVIAPALLGMNVTDLEAIDAALIRLDGTRDKGRLGANALLAVSVACAKAAASTERLGTYAWLAGPRPTYLPAPMATVIAGGEYSSSSLDFEDYLYVFDGFASVAEAVEALWETRLVLEELLTARFGRVPEVGGALAPPMADSRQAFDVMLEAAERAGCRGRAQLGLDVAASELYLRETGAYRIAGGALSPDELADRYVALAGEYPLVFLEDPFDQDDFARHAALTARLPAVVVVGDDLFVSNPERIRRGIEASAANGVLLKVNQIGTVTEAREAAEVARQAGYTVCCSLRSHDTDDPFLADFAVGVGAKLAKIGSPVRGERNAKYNRLIAIEEELAARAPAGWASKAGASLGIGHPGEAA